MHPLFKWLIGGIIAYKVIDWACSEDSKEKDNKVPTRRIFISHSWRKGSDEYKKFTQKLEKEKVNFYDHSIPMDDPFDEKRRQELRNIFRKQMIYCSKIYVLASSGIGERSYVKDEIEIAKELKKRIIAVVPHGQSKMPSFIRNNSDEIISNNLQSILKTLKN